MTSECRTCLCSPQNVCQETFVLVADAMGKNNFQDFLLHFVFVHFKSCCWRCVGPMGVATLSCLSLLWSLQTLQPIPSFLGAGKAARPRRWQAPLSGNECFLWETFWVAPQGQTFLFSYLVPWAESQIPSRKTALQGQTRLTALNPHPDLKPGSTPVPVHFKREAAA